MTDDDYANMVIELLDNDDVMDEQDNAEFLNDMLLKNTYTRAERERIRALYRDIE